MPTTRAEIFTSGRDLFKVLFFSYEKHQPTLFLISKANINNDFLLVTGSKKCYR